MEREQFLNIESKNEANQLDEAPVLLEFNL
jgi:hypothetical protein